MTTTLILLAAIATYAIASKLIKKEHLNTMPCLSCNGTGQGPLAGTICPKCNGTGRATTQTEVH